MVVKLNLKPELEAELTAQAQASAMTLEEYLLSVVEAALIPTAMQAESPEERATAFETWSAAHRPTPPLSDSAVSREGIYEGRDR
jgi:hypothetical protein